MWMKKDVKEQKRELTIIFTAWILITWILITAWILIAVINLNLHCE